MIIPVVFVVVVFGGEIALQKRIIDPPFATAATVEEATTVTDVALSGDAFVDSVVHIDENWNAQEEDSIPDAALENAMLANTNNPQRGVISERNGMLVYKVQSGDILSSIAAKFGVSLNTIYWANKGVQGRSLSLGQEIIVPPVSGVLHQAQTGETLESIATLYAVSERQIVKYNRSVVGRGIVAGVELMIPDAAPIAAQTQKARLPEFPGYYAMPTTGWNWGKLHYNNAVDIANACGTPVYAAAEGLVVESNSNGWNGGYGNFVIIEHPNGTKTRYAHNQRNVATVGAYVLQGDTIAYIGNTGLTHGPTGCHVHFEVVGAKNPFGK